MSLGPVTQPQYPHAENGARIRRARQLLKTAKTSALNHRPDRPLSQEDFAPMIGVSRRRLISLENGEWLPRGALRDRIVEVTSTEEQIEACDDEEEEDAVAAFSDVLQRIAATWVERDAVGARLGPDAGRARSTDVLEAA